MSTWRYVQNGQERGPVETAELQTLLDNGTIHSETLVWKEGFANWIAIRTVADFKVPPSASPSASAVPSTQAPPLPGSGAPPAEALSDAADIEQNKVYAVLAYIGLLFLVPLLAAPNSKFARYHTNQGIVLFLAAIVLMAASMVVSIIPFIGCIAVFVSVAIGVAAVVFMVLGIINAASGLYKPLPLIGHYQLLK